MPLVLAIKRNPDWEAGLFVSRQVVFYSASLIGVGAYLMLVAFGSLFMQRLGGDWGGALRIVFLSASIILLVLLLFSQQLRRRFKVFLATHFYANRYDYREEWLTLIRRLAQDSARAPMPELCLDALVDILDSDGGSLWLRSPDDSEYRRAASMGEGVRYTIGDVDELTAADVDCILFPGGYSTTARPRVTPRRTEVRWKTPLPGNCWPGG